MEVLLHTFFASWKMKPSWMWRVSWVQVGNRHRFQLINWPLWFCGRKESLWWCKVKRSPSFICFRWRDSRHRMFWPQGASGHRALLRVLVRTHLGSQTFTTTIHASWKVAFTRLPLCSLLCDLITQNRNDRWPLRWHVPIPKGAQHEKCWRGTSGVSAEQHSGTLPLSFLSLLRRRKYNGTHLLFFQMCPLAIIGKVWRKSKRHKIWLTYMCSRLKNSNYLVQRIYFMNLGEWKDSLSYCVSICTFDNLTCLPF